MDEVQITINGETLRAGVEPFDTLATLLRDRVGLTGTKIGCEAGDCGACTVLLDDSQVCACLVPALQCNGSSVLTVEGRAHEPLLERLQQSFHKAGAAQCGICTPGMLMSALELLRQRHTHSRKNAPTDLSRQQVEDAIGGTLCRCTGYVKIIDAIIEADAAIAASVAVPAGSSKVEKSSNARVSAVGCSIPRVDGTPKITGSEKFGADAAPEDALWMRVIRSPHAHAKFSIGDCSSLRSKHPGLEHILRAADVPGHNGFGIYPDIKDQPVLADGKVMFRGEAVLVLLGQRDAVEAIAIAEIPIEWDVQVAVLSVAEARAKGAPLLHENRTGNILIRGRTEKGDLNALGKAMHNRSAEWVCASGLWETSFVEHAYLEPEAGYAQRVGDRIEVVASTQAPQMDLDEVANVLGIDPQAVRIIPSACGGGFGGKLDVSVQPLLAVAAWVTGKPVRTVFNRVESMASSTKRHPAAITVKAAADLQGKLHAFSLEGDFNTGAYASWGPTVAGRVPVHCTGPYKVDNVFCETRAVHTHCPPSGAFRGFGTPQAAIAREMIYDQLAEQCELDRWAFRRLNAFRAGDVTPSGQQLDHSCGMLECLDAVEADWQEMQRDATEFNSENSRWRRGTGIACMWYGCGNTGLSNPSAMRVELTPEGRVIFYNGAVDIGQGSSTVLLQICADAVGLPVTDFDLVLGDTDLTEDAGKTSASRQTFVSGKAAELAGLDLRARLLALLGANSSAVLSLDNGVLQATLDYTKLSVSLDSLAQSDNVLGQPVIASGFGSFDPPITPLDSKGQGSAYATYAFAVQICTVDIDLQLGVIKPRRFVAAHDVGRAVNPQLIEGQIEGGILQGLGMALMEEYLPGRTENLHDYLIPTAGDVPQIDIRLIEAPEPLGPYGAKGVGEPALVPTPAAILSAVKDATGVIVRKVPVLPHRLHKALQIQSTELQKRGGVHV